MPDMTYGYKENETTQLGDEAADMARKAQGILIGRRENREG